MHACSTRAVPATLTHPQCLSFDLSRQLRGSASLVSCKAVPHVHLSSRSSTHDNGTAPARHDTRTQPAPNRHDEQDSVGATAAPLPTAPLLGVLDQPKGLQTAWQQDILPACLDAWGRTLQQAQQLQEAVAQEAQGCAEDSAQHVVLLQQAEEVLLQLDALLGTCQQVLLLASHLKDHPASQQWRSAAAQVFVEARSFEQEVCSGVLLQQATWACLALLQQQANSQQQQQQQQQQQPGQQQQAKEASHGSALHQRQQPQTEHCAGATDSTRKLAPLARRLLRRMQLDSQSPAALADPTQQQQQRAQVLSLQEQQAILSGLLAEQKVLINKMQALLLDPAAAPLVDLDPDSKQVLLQPLLQANIGAHVATSPTAAAAVATQTAGGAQQTAGAEQESAAGLQLDLGLVSQLLELHPDTNVRQEVYTAGLLQRLDGLLSLWGELAEVRRKIGNMHGFNSYADYVLQHSLLGCSEAARAFSKQLAVELQPGAAQTVNSWQQAQEQQLLGGDVQRCVHQDLQGLLTQQGLQDLQPYLQLPGVLAGFDTVLQRLLGLRLVPRPPRPGECWPDSVSVLELWKLPPSSSSGTSSSSSNGSGSSSARGGTDGSSSSEVLGSSTAVSLSEHQNGLLGTVYIDPHAGYAAQLLLYGAGYPVLGGQKLLSLSLRQQTGSGSNSSSSSSGSSSVGAHTAAVALGLQSCGVLCGSHAQVALGLWELCHELGHAVNFILSSCSPSGQLQGHDLHAPTAVSNRDNGSARGSSHLADGEAVKAAEQHAGSDKVCCWRVYHLHDAWQPVELLELPSTLLEVLAMDAASLQVLCRHQDTGEQLPGHLASKLARFMRAAHYNPALHQQQVLALLYDLEMADISSRQLGQHAAHHLWSCIMQDLSVMPGVEVTLQQVACLPRLLGLSGQGYGYAVARSLACVLQPLLLQHLSRRSTDSPTSKGRGLQEHWQRVFGMGTQPGGLATLISTVLLLEQESGVQQLQTMLQEQNLWPPPNDSAGQQRLFAAFLLHSMQQLVRAG